MTPRPATLLRAAPVIASALGRVALGRLRRGPRQPSGSVGSEIRIAVLRGLTLASRRHGIGWLRETIGAPPVPASLLAAVELEPVEAGGVPAVWFRPRQGPAPRSVVYLHGGGYVFGSVAGYREIAARLALEVEAEVLSVDYRLSPEHPFPAAQEDALAAMRWLLARGVAPARLGMAGDSAGAALCLATLLGLGDAREPQPAAAWLISPWVDPQSDAPSMKRYAEIDFATPDLLSQWAALHAPGAAIEDPRVCPGKADLAGLPALFVHAGGSEMLVDSIRAFCARAEQAGVAVELDVVADQVHDFPLLGVDASEAARKTATAWLRTRLGDPILEP